jgi:hypothetical protein
MMLQPNIIVLMRLIFLYFPTQDYKTVVANAKLGLTDI